MAEIYGLDAYAPAEVARRVQSVGVTKARLPVLQTLVLGVLAGAELFTGNNLLAMAWAAGQISTREVLRNWALVCAANFVGAAGLALLVFLSGHWQMNGGAVGRQVVAIALAKQDLAPWTAFFRGVLCNVLVCLAVWMAMAGRSVMDKAVAIVPPVAAFVAARLRAQHRQHVLVSACDVVAMGWRPCARPSRCHGLGHAGQLRSGHRGQPPGRQRAGGLDLPGGLPPHVGHLNAWRCGFTTQKAGSSRGKPGAGWSAGASCLKKRPFFPGNAHNC